ncbi:head-tail connector protein [Umezawaea beigongshangensis]|uniref:head-tail connector protein n=1 Tax=Umezawaea beigongshangensis TaxID=2780383 RepID=UPI0018F274F4|nr:head-tail connector protein [Umezawaea beigongshangensis]
MPAALYATLAQLKDQLNIDPDNTEDDELLQVALASASGGIDDETGRTFGVDAEPVARTLRAAGRTLWDASGMHALLVPDISSAADLLVESGSSTGTWSPITGVQFGPDDALVDGWPITELLHPTMWPAGRTQLRVTARWGWPAVPAKITSACLIWAARLYKRKDSPEGVTASAEWGPVRVSKADPDVKAMIGRFELPGFA